MKCEHEKLEFGKPKGKLFEEINTTITCLDCKYTTNATLRIKKKA